jgi:predicted amidohydrolase
MDKSSIVAAIQFAPVLLDVEKNLNTALQLTFEAASKGARVIVLPELCTGGFVLENPQEAMSVAQTKDGYQTEMFKPLAEKFNCHIVFGYVELCENKMYNSAAVVGPKGLEANFQKHNSFGSDNFWMTPSEQVPNVVMTGAGRLGVLICRDAGNNYRESYYAYNPSHKFYRKGDADTIALLTAWGTSYAFPDSAWIELVESTRANLVVSNRVGEERDLKFKGGSVVIDRDRRVYSFGSNFIGEAVVGGIVIL